MVGADEGGASFERVHRGPQFTLVAGVRRRQRRIHPAAVFLNEQREHLVE